MRPLNRILLTGAGFTYNWGGPLASEMFNRLLACDELDRHSRDLLIASRKTGGFEDALTTLQDALASEPNDVNKRRVAALTSALYGEFNQMTQGFWNTQFEFQNDMAYLVRSYLIRFNAIFTLNQDTLLEQHYLDDNIALGSTMRWTGWQIPGTKRFGPPPHIYDPRQAKIEKLTPDPAAFRLDPRSQPYFKLHGSITFVIDEFSGLMLVMGGQKRKSIAEQPLLAWYHQEFVAQIARPDTHLVIIGYGFNDAHINEAIAAAAAKGGLRIFLIDPAGFAALEGHTPDITASIGAAVKGISQRPLTRTFFDDRVEHQRLVEFLM